MTHIYNYVYVAIKTLNIRQIKTASRVVWPADPRLLALAARLLLGPTCCVAVECIQFYKLM